MLVGLAEALAKQIASHQPLRDWAGQYTGRNIITPVYGNRDLFQQGAFVLEREIPALVLEIGDADIDTLPGARLSQSRWPIHCAIVWRERCPSSAFAARVQLPSLLLDAVLTDVTLDGATAAALPTHFSPADAAADTAVRTLRFDVRADTEHRTGG